MLDDIGLERTSLTVLPHGGNPLSMSISRSSIRRRQIAASSRHIAHVHISENDRGVPGRGHTPWRAIFAALAHAGYDGWLTIEALRKSLARLRRKNLRLARIRTESSRDMPAGTWLHSVRLARSGFN
jgi:hypothetical protein